MYRTLNCLVKTDPRVFNDSMGKNQDKKPKRLFEACARSLKQLERWDLDQEAKPQHRDDYLTKRQRLWNQLRHKLEELSR